VFEHIYKNDGINDSLCLKIKTEQSIKKYSLF